MSGHCGLLKMCLCHSASLNMYCTCVTMLAHVHCLRRHRFMSSSAVDVEDDITCARTRGKLLTSACRAHIVDVQSKIPYCKCIVAADIHVYLHIGVCPPFWKRGGNVYWNICPQLTKMYYHTTVFFHLENMMWPLWLSVKVFCTTSCNSIISLR